MRKDSQFGCGDCDKYLDLDYNYCRTCGTKLDDKALSKDQLNEMSSVAQMFCGACGGLTNTCECMRPKAKTIEYINGYLSPADTPNEATWPPA